MPSPVRAASTFWRTDRSLTLSLARSTLAAALSVAPEASAPSRPETASVTLPVRPALASMAAATEAR